MRIQDYEKEIGITLYPHQRRGVINLLKHKRGGLWHSAGTGKTLEVIVALRYWEHRRGQQDITIVVPNHLVFSWRQEIVKWGGSFEWKIIPYSQLTNKKEEIKKSTIIIYDECHYVCHVRAKGEKGKRGYILIGSGRARTACEISRHSQSVIWHLSATPAPNYPYEWEGIFLSQGQEAPVRPRKRLIDTLGIEMIEIRIKGGHGEKKKIYDLKHPTITPEGLISWVTNNGWSYADKNELDLPEKISRILPLDIHYNKSISKSVDKLMTVVADDLDIDITTIAEYAMLNHQCGVIKAESSEAKSWIEGIGEANQKHVIFYRHNDVIDTLLNHCMSYHISASVISGGLTPEEKNKQVDGFVNGHNLIIFVNLAICEGMNLQVASQASFFEMPVNPREQKQASDRIHRIGSKNTCVINYIIGNKMDKHVYNLLEHKSRFYLEE